MEKAKELIEEMTMTKREVAEKAGVSYTLLNRFENGHYPGNKLTKRLIEAAKERGNKLIQMATELEAA